MLGNSELDKTLTNGRDITPRLHLAVKQKMALRVTVASSLSRGCTLPCPMSAPGRVPWLRPAVSHAWLRPAVSHACLRPTVSQTWLRPAAPGRVPCMAAPDRVPYMAAPGCVLWLRPAVSHACARASMGMLKAPNKWKAYLHRNNLVWHNNIACSMPTLLRNQRLKIGTVCGDIRPHVCWGFAWLNQSNK